MMDKSAILLFVMILASSGSLILSEEVQQDDLEAVMSTYQPRVMSNNCFSGRNKTEDS